MSAKNIYVPRGANTIYGERNCLKFNLLGNGKKNMEGHQGVNSFIITHDP